MKKVLLSIAVVAIAAITGGVTTYAVAKLNQHDLVTSNDVAGDHNITASPFSTVGSQFTSYSSDGYPDLTYAAENAVRAVVGIDAIQRVEMSQRRGGGSYDPFLEFFGIPQQRSQGGYNQNQQPQYQERRGGGSGVIISEDGYVVTNNHVIDGATKLKVKLYDGGTYDAEVIGTDPTTDIALIKIDKSGLPTLPLGSSEDLRLGEWVLAIGSPFDLQSTVTAGIVSAKARQLDVIPSEFRIESFIQTDAAVNPGNSGGALVNTKGELVGINTLIKSQTGSYVGYSFAVPESIVRKVVTDLREYGVVQRAMLGVSFALIDSDFVEQRGEELGIKKEGGAYVASVQEGGAASEAGVRKGDIIMEIDGVKVDAKRSLPQMVAMHRPGDIVKIKVKRGSSMKLFDVTLRNKAGKTDLVTAESSDVYESLGAKLVDASQSVCKELEIKGGVQVSSVDDGGLLSRARVRRGFVITYINDREILTVADINKLMEPVRSIDGVYPDGKSASYNFIQ